jgi:hypothetical protein
MLGERELAMEQIDDHMLPGRLRARGRGLT